MTDRPAPVAILAYHRIAQGEYDPLRLCVPPETFRDHLRVLEQYEVVRLDETARSSNRPRVVLTFDDGYADNASVAVPMLAERSLPATLFIVADKLHDPNDYWWDQLARLVSQEPEAARDLLRRLSGDPIALVGARVRWRRLLFRTLFLRLRDRPVNEIKALLPAAAGPPSATIGADALRELAQRPLIDVGAHSCSHSRLTALPAQEQEREIDACKQSLETVTGRPVTAFAYPYGDADSHHDRVANLVRDAGYETACVNGIYPVGQADRRWRMPRLTVLAWDAREFQRRLQAAFLAWPMS